MARERPESLNVPHFTITDAMHPKTGEIVLHCRSLVAEYANGERNSLPTQKVLGKNFGASADTVSDIIKRLRLSPIFAMGRQVDRDGIRIYFERAMHEFAEGNLASIPSYREVAALFDCSTMIVSQTVRQSTDDLQERLAAAREKAREEAAKNITFRHNHETAWFLGAMFGAGTLKASQQASGLILTSDDPDVRRMFQTRGEFIIGKAGQETQLADRKNLSMVFNDVGYAQLLAPFSVTGRTQQMLHDYDWVREKNLLESFVDGWFDADGSVYFTDTHRRVSFPTPNEDMARYCVATLKMFGIERPRIEREKKKPKRVFFGNIPDLKKFAELVHTVSREKQKVLDRINAYEPTLAELRLVGNRAIPKQVFP